MSSANATAHGVFPSVEVVERVEGLISEKTYQLGIAVLLFYMFSIVYGRLYTGMHSFTDCIVGVALGAGIWGLYIFCGEYLDNWARDNGFIGMPQFYYVRLQLLMPAALSSPRHHRSSVPVRRS